MKLEYDAKVDAAYVKLTNSEVKESEEVRPGVVLDFDDQNRVISIEILHVRKARPDIDLSHLELENV